MEFMKSYYMASDASLMRLGISHRSDNNVTEILAKISRLRKFTMSYDEAFIT